MDIETRHAMLEDFAAEQRETDRRPVRTTTSKVAESEDFWSHPDTCFCLDCRDWWEGFEPTPARLAEAKRLGKPDYE
jgi:hypothetical protein